MTRLAVLITFLGVYLTSNAQTIDYVDMEYQADVNVYFVKWKHQADAVVYQSLYKSYAREEGVWYIAHGTLHNHKRGAIKVRVVKHKYQADVLIYKTDWRYQVRVNECYRKYFKIK